MTTDPPFSAPSPADGLALDERLRALAEEAVLDTDLFVVDVVVRGRVGSRVVEVFADSEAGATVEALTALSRRLSFVLDAEDPVKGHYRLDVSTPGLGRPLTDRRQYTRHVGRRLRVTQAAGAAEPETLEGDLLRVDADALTLLAAPGDERRIDFDSIREARVVLPW